MLENKQAEYLDMIDRTKKEMLLFPDFDQLITVKTSKSYYSFANKIDSTNIDYESAFVEQLIQQNETEIETVVCIWKDGSLDFPSFHFRQLLLQSSDKNKNTIIVLQGEHELCEKRLISCMPK